MGDGPVSIVSKCTLTPEQYADLQAVVKGTLTVDDLVKKVDGLSVAWRVPVVVERVRKLKDHIH